MTEKPKDPELTDLDEANPDDVKGGFAPLPGRAGFRTPFLTPGVDASNFELQDSPASSRITPSGSRPSATRVFDKLS